jgi:hypothetical protein
MAAAVVGMPDPRLGQRGCACWVVVPYDQMRGDALPPVNRKEILEEGISMMTKTVVATP